MKARVIILAFTTLFVAPLWLEGRPSDSSQADVRDLNIQDWDCPPEGDAQSDGDQDRNGRKNRERLSLSAANAITEFDWRGFLNFVQAHDQTLAQLQADADRELKRRSTSTEKTTKQLGDFERQAVSLTGYLVVAYPGPKETCNCHQWQYHDWHMEVYEQPLDHVPDVGDPTGIDNSTKSALKA